MRIYQRSRKFLITAPRYAVLCTGLVVVIIIVWRLNRGCSSTNERWSFETHRVTDEFGIELWPDVNGSMSTRITSQVRLLEEYAMKTKDKVRSPKSILLVGEFYFDFGKAQRAFVDEKCPISECTLTVDADRYRRTVDAVVILNMDAVTLCDYLPKPAHQIWIANHWESPLHNRIDTTAIGNYINWSSSYRHDSHLVTPYGRVERLPLDGSSTTESVRKTPNAVNYAAGKTKKVAWFSSNCYEKNGRTDYAYELSRFIDVDMYGKCGRLDCPWSKSADCFKMLEKDYKFYLAFENSNCRDYVTEKVFRNAMTHNVLPIVMGAHPDDYAAVLPPHSYIHIDDFRSPRELAAYLNVLDANETLFNEYFRWKSEWVLMDTPYWCRLCGLLHVAAELGYVHWYQDYSDWWDGSRGSSCGSRWVKRDGIWWRTWN